MDKLNATLKRLPRKKTAQLLLMAVLICTAVYMAKPAAVQVFSSYQTAQSAANRKLPIYCVDTPEKKVAISFDAAWGAEDTGNLLDILESYDVKATFFLCGYWVDKYPEEVKKIASAGHDIGNHGNTHAHGAQLNLERNKQEIMGVHEKVKALLGIEMQLFRPPYGEYNNTVVQAAEESGYYTIQWDVDSHDWMGKGQQYEINQVLNHKHLGNGSIILFHNGAKDTPKTLPVILEGLKAKGFEIVPISEIIYKDNYTIDSEGRQKKQTNNAENGTN